MALLTESGFLFLLRWIHFLSGITWIGLLYYFNFVQTPFFAETDAPVRSGAQQKLLPRALWWFRWGAMITFLSGLLLFTLIYAYVPQEGLRMPGLRVAGPWIMLGMTLGLIMWFNVWFIIWSVQKKMLSGRAL